MNRTQKNKATAYHLGILKAKLAKYKRELLTPTSKGAAATGEGFKSPQINIKLTKVKDLM
jgi:ribosome-interacting GTPase 1